MYTHRVWLQLRGMWGYAIAKDRFQVTKFTLNNRQTRLNQQRSTWTWRSTPPNCAEFRQNLSFVSIVALITDNFSNLLSHLRHPTTQWYSDQYVSPVAWNSNSFLFRRKMVPISVYQPSGIGNAWCAKTLNTWGAPVLSWITNSPRRGFPSSYNPWANPETNPDSIQGPLYKKSPVSSLLTQSCSERGRYPSGHRILLSITCFHYGRHRWVLFPVSG